MLLDAGVDPSARGSHPIFRGRSAYADAVSNGFADIADSLRAAGADATGVDEVDEFIGRCMAGDTTAVQRSIATDTGIVERARIRTPDLVRRAAERSASGEALSLIVGIGFDVNASGRATALHEAAFRNNTAAIDTLLLLGADPTILDREFNSSPAGWAFHGGHAALAERLDRAASKWHKDAPS
jgi:ankyrin repeat protein